MEAGASEPTQRLREAVTALATAEAKLAAAAEELGGEDKSEVELLGEEAADVRVRVKAAADRLTP